MTQDKDQSRRRFLKLATVAMGSMIGIIGAIPFLRYLLHPVGRRVVDSPDAPVDVIAADDLVPGAAPVRVTLNVSGVRDAWTVADDQPLGSAWLRKDESGNITALSSICPHLGCAIDFNPEANAFQCPCHKSEFSVSGERQSGPSKRGLDPLPVVVEEGRVRVSYRRFRPDVPERVEV